MVLLVLLVVIVIVIHYGIILIVIPDVFVILAREIAIMIMNVKTDLIVLIILVQIMGKHHGLMFVRLRHLQGQSELTAIQDTLIFTWMESTKAQQDIGSQEPSHKSKLDITHLMLPNQDTQLIQPQLMLLQDKQHMLMQI